MNTSNEVTSQRDSWLQGSAAIAIGQVVAVSGFLQLELEQNTETVLSLIEEHIGMAWLEEAAGGWDNPGW